VGKKCCRKSYTINLNSSVLLPTNGFVFTLALTPRRG
jgi:hypothetical protein